MFKFVCGKCKEESTECCTSGVIRKGKFTCGKCMTKERAKKKEVFFFYDILINRRLGNDNQITVCKAGFRKTKTHWVRVDGTEEFIPPFSETEVSCGRSYHFFSEKHKHYGNFGVTPGSSSIEKALDAEMIKRKSDIQSWTHQVKNSQDVLAAIEEFKATHIFVKQEENDDRPSEQV